MEKQEKIQYGSRSSKRLVRGTCACGFLNKGLTALLFTLCAAAAGAQTAHLSGAVKTLGSGFKNPGGVAVDGSGNVFVGDTGNSAVKEIVAAGGYTTVNNLGSGFSTPFGVALDRSGNVFVADTNASAVKEIVAAGGYTTVNTLASGFRSPEAVAVDGSGNVFVGDTGNFAVKEILAPDYTTVITLLRQLNQPGGVAVDGSGNVFVADTLNNAVKEILATDGSVKTVGSGFSYPYGVAVDGSGNVFVADEGHSAVKEILAADGSVKTLGGGFRGVLGVAVDGSGNVFVGDQGHNAVKEIVAGDNFGAVNVGSASSSPLTLYFTFDTGGTLGSTAVLTRGAANLDFTDAGGSTCAANTTYTEGQTCTVNVTFKPLRPGPRYGAVELLDSSGGLLATGYVQGTGVGPLVSFANTTSGVYLPSAQSSLGSGFSSPFGVAVDGSGNIFVADTSHSAVKEIVAPGYTTIKTLGSGFNFPNAVAVDGSGNVLVADTNIGAVKEIVAAGGYTTVVTLGTGFTHPEGVAVDGSGNVFVADSEAHLVKEIVAPGYTTIKTLGSGFNNPIGVAVDGSGNVFVGDFSNSAVKEIVAPNYATVKSLGSGFSFPGGVAVDGSGNVFVADTGSLSVKEIVAAGGYTNVITLGSGSGLSFGVAVDGSGNVFVAETFNGRIEMLDYADPPTLSFAPTNVGSASSDSPQAVTLSNIGNADLTFPVLAGNNPSIASGFMLDGATTCPQLTGSSSTAATLAKGESCLYAVDFIPQAAGNPVSGALVLTDNNLNAVSPSYATQSIGLSGTATQIATTTTVTFSVNPAILGQPVTITATVSPSAATGTVTFTDGTTTLATRPLSGGTATYTTSALAVGTHTINASYSGDSTYQGSPDTGTLNVTYKVVALYNQTSPSISGATVPIKVQLTNYSGKNLSSSGIVVTISGLSPSPAPGAAPSGRFTFMSTSDAGPMYQYNVKTARYAANTYTLSFKATPDPVVHTVQFVIH